MGMDLDMKVGFGGFRAGAEGMDGDVCGRGKGWNSGFGEDWAGVGVGRGIEMVEGIKRRGEGGWR